MSKFGTLQRKKIQKAQDSAIVAIDFGTTQSCYAYLMDKRSGDIYVHTWDDENNSKTPTSILLEKQGENYVFKAFGIEAENTYWSAKDQENLELYRRFKMTLHKEKVRCYILQFSHLTQ